MEYNQTLSRAGVYAIESLEQMSQAERLLSPVVWVTAAFAIAVWGGTLDAYYTLLFSKKMG
jgi:hypothetical protein